MTAARRDAPRGALVVNENWRVAPLDAVVRIEDRRVDDRPEPLTGGVRRICRDERVDEDLIPLQHLVELGGSRRRRLRGSDRRGNEEGQPDREDLDALHENLLALSVTFRAPSVRKRRLVTSGESVGDQRRPRFASGRPPLWLIPL